MYCYRDLRITSRALDEYEIISYLEAFAQSTPGWSFPKEKSREYATICGVPSCCLIHEHSTLPKAALHLTAITRGTNGIYVPNIIPLDRDSMTVSEYNGIAQQFARDLCLRTKGEGISIKAVLSKSKLGLRDLIGGNVTWSLFHRYIRLFPESSHPNDLARLDAFICALSRYSKRRFDVEAFKLLLREELGWSEAMALRCKTRVEIGLEVLAARRELNSR